jgi:hypothetical protein
LHSDAKHFMPGAQQAQGYGRGIHAAGQSHRNFHDSPNTGSLTFKPWEL